MIDVAHLVKHYGSRVALDDVSFTVPKGEVVGVLGPNGAGKSSTLRILSGYLAPTAGTVRVAGHDVVRARRAARAAIGYMPEAVPLYPEMRVAEYLRFRAELKGIAGRERKAAVGRAMEQAFVADVAADLIGKLSKGYRQRVGLADALLARPPLLILDEPTAGLDPNQIREVRALLRGLAGEHTVLLSTHILAEVEATCSRVLLLHRGKLVAEGPLSVLRAVRAPTALDLELRGDEATLRRVLVAVAGDLPLTVTRVVAADDVHLASLALPEGTSAAAAAAVTERAVQGLVAEGIAVRSAAPRASSLEEVFAALTRGSPEGGPPS